MGRKLVIYYNQYARFGRPNPKEGPPDDPGVKLYRLFTSYNYGMIAEKPDPKEVWVKRPLRKDGTIMCLARAKVLAVRRERGQTTVTYVYDHATEFTVVRRNTNAECGIFFIEDEALLEPLIDESCGKATTVID
jgi:hypothetical protein